MTTKHTDRKSGVTRPRVDRAGAMTAAKPNCKARAGIGVSGVYPDGWPCYYTAKSNGYCGIHDPARRAARKRKRGPTKRERAEAQAKRLDAVLKAARRAADVISDELNAAGTEDIEADPSLLRHQEIRDTLDKALADYDRGGR